MLTINDTERLVIEQCCNCHIRFAMPEAMYNKLQQQGGSFYCPNGHGQHYTEPDNKKLKAQIERLEMQKHNLDEVINIHKRTIEQLGYSIRAQKAAKTKILNRVTNGVCPCCNRQFKDLQNHFKSKHPELLETK